MRRSPFHRDVSRSARWHAGDVIRFGEWPFADAVVLGFDDEDNALTERPYAYASSVGTTGPSVLLGSERGVYSCAALNLYRKISDKRTV